MFEDPANKIQDYTVFGEYQEVNPSISDCSTFYCSTAEEMAKLFQAESEGHFIYSRHLNPSAYHLSKALAAMEGTEAAQVTASGMSAITCTILQICSAGDEIVAARTIYGGTYALMQNILAKFGIKTHFVDITDLNAVRGKINGKTKLIYCETVSNPLLEVADLRGIRSLCDAHRLTMVVDNTFSPMSISPIRYGADIILHSLTKYINGASDGIAGAICGRKEFIQSLRNTQNGTTMLLGPVLDNFRAASILKNMHTLHVRIRQHSQNAQYLAEQLEKLGVKVFYPGLRSHPQHELIKTMLNSVYGFGGMVTFDVKTQANAETLVNLMHAAKVGYLAVSLGYYKTLFTAPGSSTSSEIPEADQKALGLTPGLVRMSVGLDQDIERSFKRMRECLFSLKSL